MGSTSISANGGLRVLDLEQCLGKTLGKVKKRTLSRGRELSEETGALSPECWNGELWAYPKESWVHRCWGKQRP